MTTPRVPAASASPPGRLGGWPAALGALPKAAMGPGLAAGAAAGIQRSRNRAVGAKLGRMAELNGLPASLDTVKTLALTNYGHFTSMRVDDNRVRGLTLHLERLVRDCRQLFDADLDPERVRHLVRHALVDHPQPIVVRVTVFDPSWSSATRGPRRSRRFWSRRVRLPTGGRHRFGFARSPTTVIFPR